MSYQSLNKQDADVVAGADCIFCHAKAGEPCRTYRGAIAVRHHDVRAVDYWADREDAEMPTRRQLRRRRTGNENLASIVVLIVTVIFMVTAAAVMSYHLGVEHGRADTTCALGAKWQVVDEDPVRADME